MTEKTVNISIAIKIEGEVDQIEKEVKLDQLEEGFQPIGGSDAGCAFSTMASLMVFF